MIDEIDRRLKSWIDEMLDEVEVSLDAPVEGKQGNGVNAYLLELSPKRSERTLKREPLQISLRYLLTTWAPSPEKAHRLLADLLFAAMNQSEFEVDIEPVTLDTWKVLGLRPRPAFYLTTPLRRDLPEEVVPRVAQPISVQMLPKAAFHGRVIGPGDQPLMGAQVELRSLNRTVYTDTHGRFVLSGVPADPTLKKIHVKAREWQTTVKVADMHGPEKPLIIHLGQTEV